LLSLASLSFVACGFSLNTGSSIDADTTVDDGTSVVDADPDALPTDAAIDAMGPTWSVPARLMGLPANVTNLTLTANMLDAWYVLANDIYHTSRASTAVAFSGQDITLSNGAFEATPEVAPDGLSITFARFTGNYDIYLATWNAGSQDWGSANTINNINGGFHDNGATISADQTMLAMSSTRIATTTSDIFISTRADSSGSWSEPAVQMELNSTVQDGNAFLSQDKLTICFDSNRTNNFDIYCATRSSPTATWNPPAPMPMPINSPQSDVDPWFTPDGKTIVFWSDRDGTGRWYVSTRP
jgi:Tol biopolymer transport system component